MLGDVEGGATEGDQAAGPAPGRKGCVSILSIAQSFVEQFCLFREKKEQPFGQPLCLI